MAVFYHGCGAALRFGNDIRGDSHVFMPKAPVSRGTLDTLIKMWRGAFFLKVVFVFGFLKIPRN